MEFSFDIKQVLPHQISLIRSNDVQSSPHLREIVDEMGKASALAQNLREAITSSSQLQHSDHCLYILNDGGGEWTEHEKSIGGSVFGMIKVGYKHLLLMDRFGRYHERVPLCVLDFYVHESKQRHGYGKAIFQYMLESQGVLPHQMAIDRPSNKFINFLSKHYSLNDPVHQGNRFTIFDAFFDELSIEDDSVRGKNVDKNHAAYANKHQRNIDKGEIFRQLPEKCRQRGRIDTNWNLFGVPGIL